MGVAIPNRDGPVNTPSNQPKIKWTGPGEPQVLDAFTPQIQKKAKQKRPTGYDDYEKKPRRETEDLNLVPGQIPASRTERTDNPNRVRKNKMMPPEPVKELKGQESKVSAVESLDRFMG